MSYNSKYKGYEVEAFLDKIVDFENQEFINKEVFTETLNSYVKNDTFDSKINTINSNINNINSDIDDVRIWKNKLADSLKYDNEKKCWYIDGDFYVTGIFGVGAAGEEGGTSGGGGGIDEDTLRQFLTENRYATEDWVTALGYITAGEVDTKLVPYATSASVTAQVSAVASGLLNLTERVTPIESWKDRLSKALKYNEQEQCWYIDGKFYVTETLGVGGIAEGGNGGSGGEGTLTGILVNGQKYDSPDEYGILSLPNYPTQEEFDGISERFQTIESYFSSSEDYDNTINKWNEIVSFLNATEGTTLAGILAAYTLKKDFNKLAVTVGENSQAIDNHETRIQTWEEWFNSTGKHLLYDKNSNALYSENFYTRGWNAAGGIGEAGSTPGGEGGGGRVNGITLNNVNYTEVDAYGNLIISELFATSTDAEALVEEIEKLKNAGHITADALIPYIKTTDADAKYSTKEYVNDTFATKAALQNLSLSVDKNAEDIVKHNERIDSLEEWYNNVGKHLLYDSDNKSVYTENFYTTKVLGAGAVGEEGNGGSGAIVDYDSVIQAIGYVPANEVTVDAISNEVSLINNEIDDIEKNIVTINQRFADYYTQDEADNKLTESINGLASDVAESLDTKANKDGSNATGNWGIGITGNAATATKLNDSSEYTIWGQKFFKDGKPSSVNGDMAVTGNASISGTTSVKTLKVGSIELTDDNGRLKVKGDVAVTGTLGVGGIGEEGGSSGGSGSVNSILIDGKTYSPTDGIIDLTQPFANVEVDLSEYYTKQEVDNKTAPLATRDFVTTEIGKIDLSPYAKSKDVQDTYATKASLSTLQGEVDNIESILGLGEEAEGYINTWGEVKDFLDKISVTDDLADTLLGINTELGNKALDSDLDAAVKRVGTLEGYFVDGIAKKATADASGNTITSTYAKQATIITAGKGLTGGGSLASNRTINVVSANDGIIVNDDNIQLNTINNLSTDSSTKPLSAAQGKALSDRLAVFENWFKADGDDTIKTTFNFFTTKTLAAGAAGEAGGGTGGGATVDYDSVVDALGFTPANVIDLDALATTVGGKQDAINTLTQNAWEAVVAKTGEVDDKLDATTAASTYLKKTDAASTYLGINAKAVSAGTADSATKATNDGSGNEITKTYATKTELSSKGTYSKPTDGIPKSDLANAVQVSLGKADSALQEEEDPIFSAHVASDITVEDIEKWNNVDNKVDKEEGKQLSTEDFTTALKMKLEALSNYDDTELSKAILTLKTQLETLIGGNASDKIDSFNEIIAFLDSVKDSEDLASVIASIEEQIALKADIASLAKVATSGSYKDLSNVPTKLSDFLNDEVYLNQALADTLYIRQDTPTLSTFATKDDLKGKQDLITGLTNESFASIKENELTALQNAAAALNTAQGLVSTKQDKIDGLTNEVFATIQADVESALKNAASALNTANGLVSSKQDKITDIASIRSNASLGASAYNSLSGYNLQDISENASLGATAYSSLSGYLPLSGGTMSDTAEIKMSYWTTRKFTLTALGQNYDVSGVSGNNKGNISVTDSNGETKMLEWTSSSGVLTSIKLCGIDTSTIIHSGNVGDYALKKVANVSSLDAINAGEFFYSSYRPTSIPKGNYVGGVTLPTFQDAANDYRAQLAFSTEAECFVRRYMNGSWGNWKTIAFTSHLDNYLPKSGGTIEGTGMQPLIIKSGDSEYSNVKLVSSDGNFIILGYRKGKGIFATNENGWSAENFFIHSGNIGSQKVAGLAKSVTIWGQSFDGSGNVSGNMTVGNNIIYNGNNQNVIDLTSGMAFGYGIRSTSNITYWALNHAFYSGDNRAMTINSSGNVGIGTSSPAYKLDVNGGGRFGHILINKGYGSNVGDDTIEMDSAGATLWMQYYHNGGINMCHGGGQVTMGGKLSVAGAVTMSSTLSVSSNVGIGTTDPQYKLDVNGSFNATTGYINGNTLIHSGNIGSQKVAGLATARNLWGQSFDGSANVRGNLFLAPTANDGNALSEKIVFTGYIGRYYGPMIGTVASSKVGGYGRKDFVVWQYNKASWASDTSGHEVALRINPSGNVTIGGSDLALTNYKLYVDGTSNFNGEVTIGGRILPSASNSYSLGTSSLRWSNVNTQKLSISAGSYIAALEMDGSSLKLDKELKITAGGTSDITPGIACAMKANLLQATNLFAQNIILGASTGSASNLALNFQKYTSISNTAPSGLTTLMSVSTSGEVTASAFYMSSDETLKDFGKDIEIDLERLKNLPKKYFTWKSGGERQIGTSAQEVQKLFPEIVGKKADGTLTVDYSKLTMPALAAIDKLYAENQELKADNQELKARLTKLERRIYG